MRFDGPDTEIDLESHGQIEFDAWRWTPIEAALDSVVAFKREAYETVVAAFRRHCALPGGMSFALRLRRRCRVALQEAA